MHPFNFQRALSKEEALSMQAEKPQASFLAGGTTLIDLMKLNVEEPRRLIDINKLELAQITENKDGLVIGALVRNSDLALNEAVKARFPVLSQAILSGATAQLRNMASTGGNLLQRTRCYYFRDPAFPCNKRNPGSGCPAIDGLNRIHAILGTSKHCIATHASDMCVALAALDAVIIAEGANGRREIAVNDFFLEPGETPEKENVLAQDELISAVRIPYSAFAGNSHYLKIRDRASFSFALVSAAVALDLDGNTVRQARIALGGVGTKPWRAYEAEKLLAGTKASQAGFEKAADAALAGAKAQKHNRFKIELAKRTIVRALMSVGVKA